MPNVWINNGAIVVDTFGNVVLCDTCPCNVIGTGTLTVSCSCCTSGIAPATWRIDGLGVVGAGLGCSSCSISNSFFIPTVDGTCANGWLATGIGNIACPAPQGTDTVDCTVTLQKDFSGNCIFQITFFAHNNTTSAIAIYKSTSSFGFDCANPVSIAIIPGGAVRCGNWPASISLIPD